MLLQYRYETGSHRKNERNRSVMPIYDDNTPNESPGFASGSAGKSLTSKPLPTAPEICRKMNARGERACFVRVFHQPPSCYIVPGMYDTYVPYNHASNVRCFYDTIPYNTNTSTECSRGAIISFGFRRADLNYDTAVCRVSRPIFAA